ncbi:MAG: SDR family oxidoreductase [Anaerolineae bacterium]
MAVLSGKTAVVTGATNGIGKVTALELAKQGARVIVVGRSAEKVEQTVSEIKTAAGNPNINGVVADLSLMADVRALAVTLKASYPRIDLLINNAGAYFTARELTSEGLERTFALNHISYFLLTTLLLDTLIASAPVRIVNVSSDAHSAAALDFDDLQAEKSFNGFGMYSRSKLMNLYFTYELARRLAARGITADQVSVNAVHPGFVDSGFFKGKKSRATMIVNLIKPLFKVMKVMVSPDQGAQTTLYVATSPETAGISGAYFSNSKLAKSNPVSYDESAAKRLWAISEQITGVGEAVAR